jgi:hypothetical protein
MARLGVHASLIASGVLAGQAADPSGRGALTGIGVAGAVSTIARLGEDLFHAHTQRKRNHE